ncbi:DUF481 domain-containing protein [Vulgatibacter sp.]|uniref:DUF481 domain-containing protein n=1 Tax=Vulgatibacter sp. TaxID=1971226 RepID=UPI00356537E4
MVPRLAALLLLLLAAPAAMAADEAAPPEAEEPPEAAQVAELPSAAPSVEGVRAVYALVKPTMRFDFLSEFLLEIDGAVGNREAAQLLLVGGVLWQFQPGWVSTTAGRVFLQQTFDTNTGESAQINQRIDRFLKEDLSVFASGVVRHNPFQGIRLHWFGVLGASYTVWLDEEPGLEVPHHWWVVHVGGFYGREYYVVPPQAPPDSVLEEDERANAGLTVGGWYRHVIADGVFFTFEADLFSDFNEPDNFHMVTSALLTTRLVGPLSFVVGVGLGFDGEQPLPSLRRTDFVYNTALRLAFGR